MSKRKWLLALIVGVVISIGCLMPSQKVSAISYGKPHKAVVIWEKKVYWYSSYRPSWKTHKSHPKWLIPGKQIKVTRYPGMGTMVTGKGYRHVSTIDKETFWMTPSLSQEWYIPYSKYVYMDTGWFSKSGKLTQNTAYKIPWKKLCKIAKHYVLFTSLTDKKTRAKNQRYVKSLHLKKLIFDKKGVLKRIE